MLFISHDLAVVKNLADRVLVLYQGQIMESGTVKEIFAPPFHPYTYSLIQAAPSMKKRKNYLNLEKEKITNFRENFKGCPFYHRCNNKIIKSEIPILTFVTRSTAFLQIFGIAFGSCLCSVATRNRIGLRFAVPFIIGLRLLLSPS